MAGRLARTSHRKSLNVNGSFREVSGTSGRNFRNKNPVLMLKPKSVRQLAHFVVVTHGADSTTQGEKSRTN